MFVIYFQLPDTEGIFILPIVDSQRWQNFASVTSCDPQRQQKHTCTVRFEQRSALYTRQNNTIAGKAIPTLPRQYVPSRKVRAQVFAAFHFLQLKLFLFICSA